MYTYAKGIPTEFYASKYVNMEKHVLPGFCTRPASAGSFSVMKLLREGERYYTFQTLLHTVVMQSVC